MRSGSLFFFPSPHSPPSKDIILLTCTEFLMHTKSQITPDTTTSLVLPHDVRDNLQPLDRNPSSLKGNFAARTPLHRPWSVNYSFYSSPFTVCILKLLSLLISLNSADRSILFGGSSGPSLSSPTFTMLLLRKMVDQGEKVHEYQD